VNIERIHAPVLGSSRATGGEFVGLRSTSRPHVTVVFTTEAGTLAALRAAGDLARRLDAQILLGIPEIVPPQYPLERPLFPVELLERRALRLISESGIREESVAIEVWFCRDRNECLQKVLGPHSLIVIGGRWHWRSRDEWKLEKWLSRRGHRVILADVGVKNTTEMLPKSNRDSVLTYTIDIPKTAAIQK
jgi:hypothetical protein